MVFVELINLDATTTKGACSEELEIPKETPKCGEVACTKEYNPFCACPADSSDPALCKTYGNQCMLDDGKDCGEVSAGMFEYIGKQKLPKVLKIIVYSTIINIQMQQSLPENVMR